MTQWIFDDLKTRCSGITVVFYLFFFAATAQAEQLPGPLVDVDWLEKNLGKVALLDVRADVNSFLKRSKGGSPVNPCGAGVKGKEVKPVAGHIPSAILIRWSLLTTQRPVAGKKTDGWLIEGADFERLMQKSGVKKDSHIIITYKGEKAIESAMAARLLFTLKYYGHDSVAILNGGTAAWMQSGRKVKFGRSKSQRGDFLAKPGRTKMVAALADVKAISESGAGQLLDVREPAGYFGVASNIATVDPQWYGHIPGASNLPMTMLSNDVGPAALLFDTETLQQILVLSGAKPDMHSIVYCNSGIMASLGWFVLSELLGNPKVSLYDGSMQEWSLEKMPVVALKRD
ncbi:MAG: rhodanese-like domain-containing protein [Candidatus Thiodiazotropha sp.]|jgi:thiosulfate/3-mercaptopyruvate sulfurtransferase